MVKGSFNLMDDILEADRCSMNVETYESLAVVKSAIKASEWTATTMRIEQPMRKSCLESYSTYQLHLKRKKEREEELKKQKLTDAAKVLSSVKANKLVHQARNIARPPQASSQSAAVLQASSSKSAAVLQASSQSTAVLQASSSESAAVLQASSQSAAVPQASSQSAAVLKAFCQSSGRPKSSSKPSTVLKASSQPRRLKDFFMSSATPKASSQS